MKEILEKLTADPRYRKNIEYGEPRSGHPEGKVSNHILELEENLEKLALRGISQKQYWKLKFLIIDGSTKGKALSKLIWFIREAAKSGQTTVDESWVL